MARLMRVGWGGRFGTPAIAGIALAAASGCGPAQAAGLSGAAAWAMTVGNTIAGTTADGPYAQFFAADGTVVLLDGDGRETGRWMVKDGDVCLIFPNDPDEHAECRHIEVEGTRGAFVGVDGSRYPFDILPGDARHLR